MDIWITIGQFALSLSILIILHECGHFFPARWFNTKVEKFYLFFDPWFSLFKFKKGDTEYGIGWLPLGGYVKIAGMIDESFDKEQMKGPEQPWEFRSKPAWQRLIIMVGGVTVNLILGILLFAYILFHWGENYLSNENAKYGMAVEELGERIGLQDGDLIYSIEGVEVKKFDPNELNKQIVIDGARNFQVLRDGKTKDITIEDEIALGLATFENKDKHLFSIRIPVTIGEIAPGLSAEKAGLKTDDQIIAVNGVSTFYFDEFKDQAEQLKNQNVALLIIRAADTLNTSATFDSLGRLGFLSYAEDHYLDFSKQEYALGAALVGGWNKSFGFIGDQAKAFGQMFKGKIKAKDSLGSFITIGGMFGNQWDWRRFWTMTAMLSVLLAFINLLPIPALDGGHVMFLLWELISGRKPSDKVLEYSTMVGFMLLVGLMIYALGLDIMRQF